MQRLKKDSATDPAVALFGKEICLEVFLMIALPRRTMIYVLLFLEMAGKTNAYWSLPENSATGTRTRVARVRAEYPNQLDYSGLMIHENTFNIQCLLKYCALSTWDHPAAFTRTLECRLKHIITMSLLHEKGNVKTFPNHFLCI